VLTVEHRDVGEHHALERAPGLAPAQRFEQLVLDPAGRGEADAQMQGERSLITSRTRPWRGSRRSKRRCGFLGQAKL